jgi:hypothetical protein
MAENINHSCEFDHKGYCTSSKNKLRKSCHNDCGYCQRHHGQKCGKPPTKKNRKVFGDITNKKVCGGRKCASQKKLCESKQCKNKELCIRCCPCEERVANRSSQALARGAKHEANLKMKTMILEDVSKEKEVLILETKCEGNSIELTDLKKLFSSDINLKNIPSKAARSAEDANVRLEKMSERALPTLLTFFHTIVDQVAEILLPGDPSFLLQKLYFVMLSPIIIGFNVARQTAFLIKMATTVCKLAKTMPRNTVAYRVVGAILVSCGTQKELDEYFPDIEKPKLGRDARRRRQNDLEWMLTSNMDPQFIERSLQRVDEDIIWAMVYDILSPDNVHLLAVSSKMKIYLLCCEFIILTFYFLLVVWNSSGRAPKHKT